MKVAIYESDFIFGFDLTAETLGDAAWITRFQTNIKREFPSQGARSDKDGTFTQWMSFSRKSQKTSQIKGS